MGLNSKQIEAVEYLDGPLLVLAGPGTGKTQLLSEKVAYILKNTDTNPENILCMTFTESGAANMKERLRRIVGTEGAKVNVSTYHSFGSEILAHYKNYSADYDRKLDSAIDEVNQFKIVKNIQEGLNGRDVLRGDSVKDIISVISAAKSAGLSAKDLQLIAKVNIDDSEVLSRSISPLLKNLVPRDFEKSFNLAYHPIYDVLQKYTDAKPIVKNIERSIVYLARDLHDATAEAESEHRIKPLSNWKDKYFEKDQKGNYRLKDRIANMKLLSVANVMSLYDQYLLSNGLYDFDDMIEEAARILHEDAGFRATLSERFQFIMLDEFQDTNPSQFAIIKELTDYEKPMIMAVGDDDQAIYEFQGALSTNLTDFQKHYSANVIALTENYRSTQEILDFAHKIITEAPDRFADKELVAHKEPPKTTQIYRHEFKSSDMEYAFIANEIARLIKSGVKQSEIAIISYKTKYFMPLLPFLASKKGLNIAYEKKDNLLEDEKIHQLITIAKYIDEIAHGQKNTVSILEVLSYPFFNLPIIEVIKIVDQARTAKQSVFNSLTESKNPAIFEVANFFSNLVAKSLTEPLEIWFDYLIGAQELDGYRSPFLAYYTKTDYDAFSLYEKLASLRSKIRKHFGEDQKLKLSHLVSMIDDYEEASMPINTSSPYRDAEDAVQILTAHKAKGLEFSYVFIISADHVAWGKGKGNNNLLALPRNLMQIRHTGTTDGEKLRILYVALTRAKDAIYITNSLSDFNGKSPERLEYLEEYDDGGTVFSPLIPFGKVISHLEVGAYASAENNLINWLSLFRPSSPDLRAIYKERVQNYRMSASSLTSFIDIVYAGPQEFFKKYILRAPREPETEALIYGDLAHKTFEATTNRQLSAEQAVQFFTDELKRKDLSTEMLQILLDKGPNDLKVAFAKFKDILYRGKAEVDLSHEKISFDGVPITGKLDHIIIDDTQKTIEVYDFKTGGYHKEKWQSHATLYKYMLQLEFYKLLLNNSPTYRNYRVSKAHILFVTPDRDGEVYDKEYEYYDKDEVVFKNLLKAVYNSIKTLSFIDDDEIFVPSNPSLGLKEIKSFVELLLAKNA